MKWPAIIFLSLGFLVACNLSQGNEALDYPEYFPPPVYDAQLSDEKIRLGQTLFYDPVLSRDGTISCASCHSPYNAFAHTDHELSHGIDDQIGTRNAPALFNLAWHNSYMWDGAINHLDMQSLAPISDAKEMGESIDNLVNKLQQKELYPPLFQEAYGDSIITGQHILKSLASFQSTLVSANSKYDKVRKGIVEFSLQEKRGYQIFQENCNACHTEPLFSNYNFANNGLPADSALADYGKWNITHEPTDSLLFKVPSLRNLSYTFPYMHDGRFRKLSEVLTHYNSSIQPSPTLSPEIDSIDALTSREKKDLISFLLTLNDTAFVFNPENKYPMEILKPRERVISQVMRK